MLTAPSRERLNSWRPTLPENIGECGLELCRPISAGPKLQRKFSHSPPRNLQIDLLINNAGFGAFGLNHEIKEERLGEMIQVNCPPSCT